MINSSLSSLLQYGQSTSEKIAIFLSPLPLTTLIASDNGKSEKLTRDNSSNLSSVKSFLVFGSTTRPSTIKKSKLLFDFLYKPHKDH